MVSKKKYLIILIALLGTALTACGGAAYNSGNNNMGNNGNMNYTADNAGTDNNSVSFSDDHTPAFITSSSGDFITSTRIVIKSASLEMIVPDPVKLASSMISLAENYGGYIVSSETFTKRLANNIDVPAARVTFRVPANMFSDILTLVEAEGVEIISKEVTGRDVTQEYSDLEARLRNWENAAEQLELIMDEADKTEDVLDVYQELVSVTEEIERLKGRITYLEESAAYSSISVAMHAPAPEIVTPTPTPTQAWQPGETFQQATKSLKSSGQSLAEFLIWVFVFFIPIGLMFAIPAGILFMLYRRFRPKSK